MVFLLVHQVLSSKLGLIFNNTKKNIHICGIENAKLKKKKTTTLFFINRMGYFILLLAKMYVFIAEKIFNICCNFYELFYV